VKYVGGAVVLAWCVAAAWTGLAQARRLPPDLMPRLDQEFHAFARVLPSDTVIGYLEPYRNGAADAAVQMQYAAQYALAPHVIVPHVGPDFLIVARDTARPGGDSRLANYVEVLEIPGGHRLFRRTD